jgi:hypothetical protein
MSRVITLMPRTVASLAALSVLTTVAWAQQSPTPTTRIRGTIEVVDGSVLTVKTREGDDVKVRMTDNVAIVGVAKISMSDVKEGAYIGVSTMPQPDGTEKAISVHIIPESERGAFEGVRPWDVRANSSMTNATVAETVKGTDGQNITIKYKDGEKKVVVPPDTPIVRFVAGDKSEVKAGNHIIIFRAVKKEDGMLETNRINVGRDGLTPAM